MTERPHYEPTPDRYTTPAVVERRRRGWLRGDARLAAFWLYSVPLCALAVAAIVATLARGPVDDEPISGAVGTMGAGGADEATPGTTGGQPFGELNVSDPRGEVNHLGMLRSGDMNLSGRRVNAPDVRVVDVNGEPWLHQGYAMAPVTLPSGTSAFEDGALVTVSGVVEPDERGGLRVRATSITPTSFER